MLSLRDTAFAIDPPGTDGWSLRITVGIPAWPAVSRPAPSVASLRNWARRFSDTGSALRELAAQTTDVWAQIDRDTVVAQIRDRLRDPLIIRQGDTSLCGPASVVMQFCLHAPVRWVRAAAELLRTGRLTCPTGRVIEAEADLRARPVPASIAAVDWLLAATLRDEANLMDDVDDGQGAEGMTAWWAMRDWVKDVLGLPGGGWETCFVSGEPGVMRKAQHAVDHGGVAFFCIESTLLHTGEPEEKAWWRRSDHHARKPPAPFGPKVRSEEDKLPWPNHWIAYLGGLDLPADPDGEEMLTFRVWSWGSEFEISCTVDAFGEYLYAGVTGTP